MKKIILILAILPNLAMAENCNQELAFSNGIDAIKEKFPTVYEQNKPYKIEKISKFWVVFGNTAPGLRGGGAPEAKINQFGCEVVGVSLSR